LDGDLTAKVWPHGSVEPAEWMLTWKHGGARAGFPGLTGGGETGVSASFADFSLRAAGPIGTVETPTIGLASGTYIAAQKIALSCGTDGAVIRYTLDSSEPNARSLRYYPDNPISIGAKNTVLKVKAIRPGLFDSKTVTATYHVLQNVSIPVFAPGEGNYTAAQSIAISSPTAGAVIHYTTDGTEPTEASPVATGPIALNASTILKARAFAPDMNASLVAAGTYQLIRFGPELHKEDFQAGFPGAAWTTSRGSGSWGLNAGALVAIDDVGVWDTNKAILNKTERAFPDDLSISARLRVDKWVPDSDASRAGIALGAGIADGRGYNLIFFKDQATLAMLDDGVAWGPKFNFPWKTGTWYRLRLASYRGVLHGRVWADGSPEPDTWQLNWARTGRVGFPALNGGYSPGQAVSFDQVKVEGTSALSGR